MRRRSFLALLLFAASASAVEPRRAGPLIVGDDAPELRVGAWLLGTPVEHLDRGKVYIVELWGTWNSQCKVTLPALADVARRHADVACIAVSVREDDPDAARELVRATGDALAGLHVAVDDRSTIPPRVTGPGEAPDVREALVGSMTRDWWLAGGSEFSPVAFIVNADGVIAWAGKAMRVEAPLKQILAGTFDRDAARREAIDLAAVREQSDAARDEWISGLQQLANPNDPTEELALADALLARHPGDVKLTGQKIETLLALKRYDEAYALADAWAATAFAQGDSMTLNRVAWAIVGDDSHVEHPDVARAKRYAEQAVEASDRTSGAILDTLARAQYLAGEFAAAADNEARAAVICDDVDQDQVAKCLSTYRAAATTRPTK